MGQNQGGEMGEQPTETDKKEVSDELSFYSDDSYEYCPFFTELAVLSKFKNINKIKLATLNRILKRFQVAQNLKYKFLREM